MNQSPQAVCHCIISHPSKAKFLAVKHADGWSPPVALVDDNQPLPDLVHQVNEGLMNNYGFMTVGLRQLAASPGYRCIEMDMLSPHGRAGLQAVWVGREEYSKFRRSDPGQFDPMAAWLEEKERGGISPSRPPWESVGWFAEARSWIQDSLKQLNIRQNGPVEQYRAFRTTSCLLRVPIGRGHVYFKAGLTEPPREAVLTRALAEAWPETIDAPLKVDEQRNWMLTRDYGDRRRIAPAYEDFPRAAAVMAEIQLDSVDSMQQWRELGCREVTLDQLSDFAARLDRLAPLMKAGGGEMALSDQQVEAFTQRAGSYRARLEKLAGYAIPDTLVHPDFWISNLTISDGSVKVHDWSGTTIAHPFFSMMKLIRFRDLEKEVDLEVRGDPDADRALMEQITDTYLAAFDRFEPPERLAEAFALVQGLYPLWRLHRWHEALAFEEAPSVNYQMVVRHLQRIGAGIAVED